MIIGRRMGLVAMVATLAVVAAACSDVKSTSGGTTGGGAANVAQCGDDPITLAVNAWVGAEANAAVAASVMKDQMGCEVELVKIDEFPQFPALARGELDATLEVWPSVHPKEYKQYIKNQKGVVDGGELGVVGNIGWFMPSYVLDENPDFASYEGIKGNEDYFATTETGDQGQFLGSDPNFGFYDEEIAQNLGLDLQFVYSGSETASIAALAKATKAKDPLLMYFWSPHWAQEKYDLVEVELPAYNQQCAKALENADADGYACDYADDVLYKAFSDQLQTKDPAAFEFLSNFAWTAEDQNAVGLDLENGMSPAEAGKKWAAANQDVWQQWLPAA
ncbi:MAG: glycine betaine ABC transporter substrate-binding protein [Actinomycetota bacterium]